MPDDRIIPEVGAIARRYGLGAAQYWQLLLNHFALSEGFSLLLLIVPDRDAAALCRHELAASLHGRGQRLATVEPESPKALQQLATAVLAVPADRTLGAVWASAVVPTASDGFAAWQTAWHWALSTINQQRNPLRRRFACPVVLVGAPWLEALLRETAPDLWSVRTQVIRIEPDRAERMPGWPRRAATRPSRVALSRTILAARCSTKAVRQKRRRHSAARWC